MKRLLWLGDAGCESGFGRATHQILDHVRHVYDVAVIGVNYHGDPHPYPYPMYPATSAQYAGDQMGATRLLDVVPRVKPDVIVLQSNPWNIPGYLARIRRAGSTAPVIGIIAVEGKNCKGTDLNGLTRAIFWTAFAQAEAEYGGMTVPSAVIPLGVDTAVFTPGSAREAREALGLPERCLDAFIVGNVNRNQARKRLDLSIQYFSEWIRSESIEDAYLYLHAVAGSTTPMDCEQLAKYYGMQKYLILSDPPDVYQGVPRQTLVQTYQAFSAQLSTTLGEGWGLTSMEGMSCGIPQALPDYSAFGEWARGAAVLVPCAHEGIMPDVFGMIGGVADKQGVINALDMLYRDSETRAYFADAGRALVNQERFSWPVIAQQYATEIARVVP